MNNKNKILAIVLIAILILAIFVYFQKNNKNVEDKTVSEKNTEECDELGVGNNGEKCGEEIFYDLSSAKNKDECLKIAEKLDERSFASQVLASKNKEEYGESGIPVDRYVYDLALRDLSCKIETERKPEYKELLNFYVDNSNFAQRVIDRNPNVADYYRQWFDDIYEEKYSSGYFGFINNLALGDFEKICPEQLPLMCQRLIDSSGSGVVRTGAENECQGYCQKLETYASDQELFKKEVLEGSDATLLKNSKFNRVSLAIAYRFGGKDSALQICSGISDPEVNDECLELVDVLEISKTGCNDATKMMKDLLCYHFKQ